ncbi:condensation domain-containing protein [Streptomyces sp. NPDC096142]|uniref:condensation domain-containing protein n=1 Tax=Streptomyces sp. NPDC096142 TaxID=3366077 RepID=UPI00380238DF
MSANSTQAEFSAEATIPELLETAAARWPHRPALHGPDGSVVSHGELAEETGRLAGFLAAHGVRRGSAVGVLGEHSPRTVAVIVAILRCGAYYVPLDHRWPPGRAVTALRSLGATALVVSPGMADRAFEIAAQLPDLQRVLLTGEADRPPRKRPGRTLRADGDSGGSVRPDRRRVVELVTGSLRPGGAVAVLGHADDALTRDLRDRAASLQVALEPEDLGAPRARDLTDASHAVADVGVVLLPDRVRSLSGPGQLRTLLHEVLTRTAPGTAVVLSDIVAPDSGAAHGAFRVPRDWWPVLARSYPGMRVVVDDRAEASPDGGCPGYHVVLTAPDTLPAEQPVPVEGGAERPLPLAEHQLPLTENPLRVDDTGTPLGAPPRGGPEDLAYTITTSGSTGEPKLVGVRHRSVVNLVEWFTKRHAVTPDDVLLQVVPFTFDLSVYDLFGVLAAGGSLVLLPVAELEEPDAVVDALLERGITLWNSAPAAFTTLLPFLALRPRTSRDRLRRVFLSGDWVPLSTHADLAREFPSATLVALGGPTETCVWTNDHVVDHIDPDWRSVPYGRPIQNVRCYVLREDGSPCDLGEAGELYAAGVCVSAGYLNDPELTLARFLPDPWGPEPGARMFRTGDRARWTEHGWMEILGRIDQQVKISGFRIELGEVEQAARSLPGVAEAYAVPCGDPHRPELGLFVRAFTGGPTAGAVRERLHALLPGYMVPSLVRVVDTLPLGPNGKVDRRALADTLTRHDGGTAEPDTGAVGSMVAVWERAFGRPVAADDEFFDAGGTSLAAARIVAALREEHGVQPSVAALYDAGSPRRLAALVGELAAAAPDDEPAARREGPAPDRAPLSVQQEAIWYIEQMTPGSVGYTSTARIDLRGPLDPARLRRALAAVTVRHPMLRTRFPLTEDGVPEQVVSDEVVVDLDEVDGVGPIDEAVRAAGGHLFDLEKEPPVRWTLLRVAADEHVLVQVEHHFAHDGWSMWLMLRDMARAYVQLGTGDAVDLGADETPYTTYCLDQHAWLASERAREQVRHWTGEIGPVGEPLAWPHEERRPERFGYRGDTRHLALPAELDRKVRDFARRAGATPFAVLMTAYTVLIGTVCAAPSLIMGGGLRNRRTPGVRETVGMFVNTCAWSFPDWGDRAFDELVRDTTLRLARAMENQEIPFPVVAREVRTSRDPARNPVFQTSISMNDWPDPVLDFGAGVTAEMSLPSNGGAKFDLDVIVLPESDGTRMLWRYSSPLFTRPEVEVLVGDFLSLLEAAVTDSGARCGQLGRSTVTTAADSAARKAR